MKIVKIGLSRFQGAGAGLSYELSGVDVFCGRNGVGKSRVLQAAQLAVAGYVPNPLDGTQVEAIDLFSKNAGATKMDVWAEIEGGPSIARQFRIVADGDKKSVKQTITINGEAKAGMKQAEKDFKEQVGEFSVMVDPSVFSRMTMKQRAEFFLGICPSPDVTPVMVAAATAEVLRLTREVKALDDKAQTVAEQAAADPKRSAMPAAVLKEKLDKARKNLSAMQAAAESQSVVDPARASLLRQADELKGKLAEFGHRAVLPLVSGQAIAEFIVKAEARLHALHAEVGELEKDQVVLEEALKNYLHAKEALAGVAARRDELRAILEAAKKGICPVCSSEVNRIAADYVDEVELLVKEADVMAAALAGGDPSARLDRKDQESENARARIRTGEELLVAARAALNDASKLVEIEQELAALPAPTAAAEAKIQLDALAAEVNDLEERLRKATQEEAVIAQAKQWRADAEKLRGALALAKQEQTKMQSLRLTALKQALEAVEQEALALFGEGCRRWNARLGFRWVDERGDEAIDIGWYVPRTADILGEGEAFVNFDNLSESQKALTLAALLPPLIYRRQGEKLKLLIMDNCEIFDPANRLNLLRTLTAARAQGRVDNAIVASSAKFPEGNGAVVWMLDSAGQVTADEQGAA